ncbi:MAG: hypothetical protein JOY93_12325 [Acidobacteriales bacterium]|nr:hypothetical protein [Terriglobales bacterium]
MTEPTSIDKAFSCRRLLRALVVLLLAAPQVLWSQTPEQSGRGPSESSQSQTGRSHAEGASKVEEKISAKDAEELFREVDRILQFASKDTGLPVKHEVKRRLTSRDEVASFVSKHLREDKDAQRLRRSEAVLKKFGLLPRDFDLSTFLVALLREQVAGYYDPETKTVNLLDWVDLEGQRPVLAHELTHALQDQSFNLDAWMKVGDVDLDKKKDLTPADMENDEIGTVRQAVVEGQATAVLLDYMLVPLKQSLLDSPQVVQALEHGMLEGTADAPQFKNSPIYLREALTFPYRYGLDFTVALLKDGGKSRAFAQPFKDAPYTTRQVMEPETYLSGERIPPLPLPNLKRIFKDYDRFDAGAIGEFDVDVLIDQYAGVKVSQGLYPHWRGGYYYAVRQKENPSAPLGILYVSRWSRAETAAQFADIYARALTQRYKQATEIKAQAQEEAKSDVTGAEPGTGKRIWRTEEGPVVIDVEGENIVIAESLDPAIAADVARELFGSRERSSAPQ